MIEIEKDKPITDEDLTEFIEDAESKEGGDDWWNDCFYEEAGCVAKEMRVWKARAMALGTELLKEKEDARTSR